jgi:type I restriction enzyme S subunit
MNATIQTLKNREGKRELPEGWRWVKLGDLMPKFVGSLNPANYSDETFVLHSIPAFDRSVPDIVFGKAIGSSKQVVLPGDVLLSKIVPHIRRTWVVGSNSGKRMIASTEWIVFRTTEAVSEYLKYALTDNDFHREFMDTTSGVGGSLLRARPALVAQIEIPLPPIPEQKRIAAILKEQMSAVEKARAAAQARLAAVKALPAAFLRQVFPQVGQSLPEGWRWVKLGEVCNERTEIRNPVLEPETVFKYVDITSVSNTQKCITEARQIIGKEAPSRARQVIRVNDVIVATTRPNLNAVAQVPPELDNQICSTGFCVLRAQKGIFPDYLFAFVQHEYFIKALTDLVNGALYPAVKDGQVFSQPIPLPPLADQQRIAANLKDQMATADKARISSEEELNTINALPAALLRRAFNGEL